MIKFDRTDGGDVFQDWLDREFGWRRIELTHHEKVVRDAPANAESLAIRSAIPILYAHWEGFVKAAGTAYLNFVLSRRKSYDELKPNFLALGMKGHLLGAGSSFKGKVYVEAW